MRSTSTAFQQESALYLCISLFAIHVVQIYFARRYVE
jgi:hypothetical protein